MTFAGINQQRRPGDRPPGATLADHGRLLVRRAIDRDDWIAEAIFDIAANGKREWTPSEWEALLTEISGDDMTIADFITLYGDGCD